MNPNFPSRSRWYVMISEKVILIKSCKFRIFFMILNRWKKKTSNKKIFDLNYMEFCINFIEIIPLWLGKFRQKNSNLFIKNLTQHRLTATCAAYTSFKNIGFLSYKEDFSYTSRNFRQISFPAEKLSSFSGNFYDEKWIVRRTFTTKFKAYIARFEWIFF